MPLLQSMGFESTGESFPSKETRKDIVRQYKERRNFPGSAWHQQAGRAFTLGTISIRELAGTANRFSETYLNELVWRDFYQAILWHFHTYAGGESFKRNTTRSGGATMKRNLKHGCEGRTGYPIVDAGMRELNATGFMHNRVRMITASFLTKHLLIDWRWGEGILCKKLLDYDYAANNGGWQWAAGSGCDAAPYFQGLAQRCKRKKFDKDLKYIRKWVPELGKL